MRGLLQYIMGRNTPDKISVKDKNGKRVKFYCGSEYARPFIFDVKNNLPIFYITSTTHIDLIQDLATNDRERFYDLGYKLGNDDIRYNPKHGTYEEWKRMNPNIAKNLRSGRLWDVLWNDKPTLFIAWWDELSKNEFIDFNTALVKNCINEGFDEMHGDNIEDYVIYCVDNNGKIFQWEPDEKNIIITKRSKESEEIMNAALAVRLATQEEKKKFFADFKKMRDEKNQKIYNHTKSKTEAEYRSLKYQESLEQ